MPFSRRKFIQGCCAGIIAMQGSRLGNLAFGAAPGATQDIVVTIFLRGAMDGMSLLVPHGEPNYKVARPRLGMSTAQVLDLNGLLGLHPSAAHMMELVQAGHLGLVCACGSPDPTRSHFDAQDYMEHGTPGRKHYMGGGWLARHTNLYAASNIFQAISLNNSVPASLEGSNGAISLDNPGDYTVQGDWDQRDDLRRALRTMYGSDAAFGPTALNTLNATDLIEYADPGNYVAANGAVYPNGGFGDTLESLAQLIRLDMGLMAATIDLGGWDTHESQADGGNASTGYFANQVAQLSDGLFALWTDLADWHGKLTVVVMSEFGRRLKENNNRGTDHGHGNVMLVLSADLARGGLFGRWPGLDPEDLFEGVDLKVTTDYRTVLSEVLLGRTQTKDIGAIFPGFRLENPTGLFGLKNSVSPEALRGFMDYVN
jgi:uncharacterized protein (DUF1501 family)